MKFFTDDLAIFQRFTCASFKPGRSRTYQTVLFQVSRHFDRYIIRSYRQIIRRDYPKLSVQDSDSKIVAEKAIGT